MESTRIITKNKKYLQGRNGMEFPTKHKIILMTRVQPTTKAVEKKEETQLYIPAAAAAG